MVSTPAHVEVFLLCTCRRGSSATTGRPTWEFRPTLLLGPGRRRCGTGCERLPRGRHDLSGAQSAMDRLLRTYFSDLDAALAGLPKSRRQHLVAEIRQHVDDARAEWPPLGFHRRISTSSTHALMEAVANPITTAPRSQ